MSLIAYILYKIFGKKSEKPTSGVFGVSNFIAAFLFAAGHVPLTFILLGDSPIIIFRYFLLNGGCHIMSKLIWLCSGVDRNESRTYFNVRR